MKNNDGRQSRVPLGTFGSSVPPPPADEPEADEGPSEAERRKRYTSTLVGHPTASSIAAPAPNNGPILAPPKWQGAQAYEGQESQPQPRVSEVPSSSVAERTQAVGTPLARISPVRVDARTLNREATQELLDDGIGEVIEELLEKQASVPTVRDSIPELPIDDVLLEAFDEPEAAPVSVAAPPPPPSRESPPEALRIEEEPIVVLPRRAPAGATRTREPTAAAREAREVVSEGPASLAPAEVAHEDRQESSAGIGWLMVAAVLVIGVGGYLITERSYPGPARNVAPPMATAAAATENPSPAPGTTAPQATATAPAQGREAPAAPAPVADEMQAAPAAPAEHSASKPRRGSARSASRDEAKRRKPPLESRSTAAAPDDAQDAPVLKLTPRDTTGLPDTPSRADVMAALEPISAKVRSCAEGQRGIAEVDITVADTGAVTYAVVGGDFAGTPEGSCIARVVRTATFTPFKKPRFRIIYPFSL